MNPWLVWTDAVRIPAYMTCLMTAAVLSTFVLAREIRASGLPRRPLYDLALLVVPAGFVGARLFILLESPGVYLTRPWLLLTSGGWVFYGAFLTATATVMFLAAARGLDPWRVVDVFAPALPFAIVFGRLGCLAAGCCHGRPADWPLGVGVPWAVRYYRLGHVPEELLAVPLHPSPLYESALGLGLFVLTSRVARRKRFEGQVLLTLLIGYGLGRGVLELFRGDLERGFHLGGWVTTSQLVAGVSVLVGAVLWRRRSSAGALPA